MKKRDNLLTIVMSTVFLVVTLVWFGSFFVTRYLYGSPQSPGTAGDLFGAIGALFSGWAFVGVLWAILLQRKALQLQHQDLKATLEEMKQAREAHEESAETLRDQVETTRLQTRVQVLTNLIEIPLRVDSNKFLTGFSEHVAPQRKKFKESFAELAEIAEKLREKANVTDR